MKDSTSELMQWHKKQLGHDGKMRHPANSDAWKHVDRTYAKFADDARNIRLGLASDGFNPFGILNVTYTTDHDAVAIWYSCRGGRDKQRQS